MGFSRCGHLCMCFLARSCCHTRQEKKQVEPGDKNSILVYITQAIAEYSFIDDDVVEPFCQ